jgi:hypothetical protein
MPCWTSIRQFCGSPARESSGMAQSVVAKRLEVIGVIEVTQPPLVRIEDARLLSLIADDDRVQTQQPSHRAAPSRDRWLSAAEEPSGSAAFGWPVLRVVLHCRVAPPVAAAVKVSRTGRCRQ